jgi:hypothetical protein
MGSLDDAIREHLDLKRRLGAPEEELEQKEAEAFGPARSARPAPQPPAAEPAMSEPATAEPEPADPWVPPDADDDLLERDEVLPEDSLEPNGSYAPPEPLPPEPAPREPHEDPFDELIEEDEEPSPPSEDVLEETPDFLEETPEHDRLWFEQKPPKDFDLD